MTAEEYFKEQFGVDDINSVAFKGTTICHLMIEFAKQKVTEALQAAANKATTREGSLSDLGLAGDWDIVIEVDKESILNSYNINQIK